MHLFYARQAFYKQDLLHSTDSRLSVGRSIDEKQGRSAWGQPYAHSQHTQPRVAHAAVARFDVPGERTLEQRVIIDADDQVIPAVIST